MRDAVVYLRKSRADLLAEQKGEGETLARHEKILREFAAKEDILITQVYKEVVSGDTIAARPQIQLLLKAVETGSIKNILIVDLDRLSRGDLQDQGMIVNIVRRAQCYLITPGRTYDPNNEDDMAYIEFGLFFARQEYRRIKGRLERGLDESVKEGQWLWVAPFGYKAHYLVEHGRTRTLVPVPEQAEEVHRMFERCAAGYSTASIAEDLHDRGVPTSNGGQWSSSQVSKILSNPVYIGKVYRGRTHTASPLVDGVIKKTSVKNETIRVIADGLHEPLISQELWDAARVEIGKRTAPIKRGRAMVNPYSSILVCSKCLTPLRFGRHKQYSYLRHPTGFFQGQKVKCKAASSPFPVLNRLIIEQLKEELEDFEVIIHDEDKVLALRKHEEHIATLKRDVAAAERALDKLYDLYLADRIDEKRFISRRDEALRRRALLSGRLEEAEQQTVGGMTKQVASMHEAISLLDDDSVSPEDKNAFLKTFIERIEYSRVIKDGKRGEIEKQIHLHFVYKNV